MHFCAGCCRGQQWHYQLNYLTYFCGKKVYFPLQLITFMSWIIFSSALVPLINSKWECFPWRSQNRDFSFVLLLSFEAVAPESHTFTTKLAFWCHDLMFPDILVTGSYFGAFNHTILWDHDQTAHNHAWEMAVYTVAKEQKDTEAALHILTSSFPNVLLCLQSWSAICMIKGCITRSCLVDLWQKDSFSVCIFFFLHAQKHVLWDSGWTFKPRVPWLRHISYPL